MRASSSCLLLGALVGLPGCGAGTRSAGPAGFGYDATPMSSFEHDGVGLAYDVSGPADTPRIVLIHGLSSARTTWDRITPALRERYRVFRLDLRGHGDSTHAPGTYTLDRYSPDVIAFLLQVVGSPAVLVGHSLGGVVAADVARRRPDLVTALVLEDPPMYRGDPSEQGEERGRIASFFPAMRQMAGDMQGRSAPIEDYVAVLRSAPALNGRGTMADVLARRARSRRRERWRATIPRSSRPPSREARSPAR